MLYDTITYCYQNIEEIIIPSFIKIIGPCAFSNCSELKEVKFETNSELRTIEESSFQNTKIEVFNIPPHLTKICECAFLECNELITIEFPNDSEIQTIENYAFSKSTIESLDIPSSLVDLKENWCEYTNYLNTIAICPNN